MSDKTPQYEIIATDESVGVADANKLPLLDATGKLHTSLFPTTGLDADLLDGQHGAFYLARANHTGTQAWATITGTPTTLAGYGVTDAQPLDATLTALAGANWALNSIPIGTGADTLSQVAFAANTFPARASTGNVVAKPITDFALSMLDDVDDTAVQATLGLGTAAKRDTGTSGANVPLLDGANTWSLTQTFAGATFTTVSATGSGTFGASGTGTKVRINSTTSGRVWDWTSEASDVLALHYFNGTAWELSRLVVGPTAASFAVPLAVTGEILSDGAAAGVSIDRRDTSAKKWTMYSAAGNFQLYNQTTFAEPFSVADGAANNTLVLNSTGAAVTGAISATNPITSTHGGSGGTDSAFVASHSSGPKYGWNVSGQGVDGKLWDVLAAGSTWSLRVVNDAISAAATALRITRSGASVTSIEHIIGGTTRTNTTSAGLAVTGAISATTTVKTGTTTVAGLPTGSAGMRHFVTDANATTFASVVAGGGTNGVPVYHDGTSWRIG